MTHASHALKLKALTGFVWVYGASISGRVFVLVATLVLARILAPEDFGLIAFALAILAYLDTMVDLGASHALVYRSDAKDARVSSTAFWTGVAGALVLTVLVWILAPSLAALGGDPDLVWIFRVLTLQFALLALGSAHYRLLQHSLEFRRLFIPELLNGLAKGVTSIALAYAGFAVWSLVLGQLAGSVIATAALWIVSGWRPSPVVALREVLPLLRFGGAIMVVAILGQAIRNVDYLVIGARIGATELGYYTLAFRIPELAILGAFQAAYGSLFPLYARLQELREGGQELARAYLQSVRVGSLVAFPLGFGLAALAVPTVLILYGERWRPSAVPLALIAVWAAFTAVSGMPGTLFKALGRPGILVRTAVLYVLLLLPALWFGAGFGIDAVAAAVLATQLVYLLCIAVVTGRILAFRWTRTLVEMVPGILFAAAMAAVVYPLTLVLAPALALVVGIAVGGTVYVALLRAFVPDDLERLLAQGRRVLERARAGALRSEPVAAEPGSTRGA